MPSSTPESKVEVVKRESHGLRGSIADGLASPSSHFGGGDPQLLKFHGIYQGVDRDTATERKQSGVEKDYEFMIRVKIPGGRLTAEQYLALDDLAGLYGNGNMRVTTRQGIQYHSVLKADLKPTISKINDALLTTLSACGDVVRNVTATPAPIADKVHRQLQDDAALVSRELSPRTRGYHEVWVDGASVVGSDETDPLYGDTYLPRKFKIGLATPEDNSIDVLSNDLGIIALFEGQTLLGYNLAVGGGLGMTHNKPQTYPRLATPLTFVPPGRLIEAVKAVILVQRDHGDRVNRKHARLKYLLDEKGTAWFKAEVEARLGTALDDPRPMKPFRVVDHMGWHPQGDGKWYFGLPIDNGRIRDGGGIDLRTGLRAVVEEFRVTPILMPTQDILLADVEEGDKVAIETMLQHHGVMLPATLTPVARWAMACPALPTCSLALNEAERIRVPLIAEFEAALARHGLADAKFSVRITGCPNGCARPYAGDVGLVGRTPNEYAIYLGGDFEGTRLSTLVFERIRLDRLVPTLEPLFEAYRAKRAGGEGFGDFCHRLGRDALRTLADGAAAGAA
ncbi:MAG: NADPH-dependent assimilatory sulfite reductase hemoprotein subunit [Alphaproteobacteria bacterium]